MIPVVFSGCAGWLHPAKGATTTGRGVVICEAFGYEAMCAHRAVLALAEMMADAGLTALRFHYRGTGNSAGDEAPGQIDRWIDSIGDAMRYLREVTGIADVALCGLRLGGLLAVEAARRFGDVSALALLAPVLSGRGYTRELKLSAAMLEGGENAAPSDWLQIFGHRLHDSDLARLRAVDLRATAGAGAAPRVLLMAPETDPPAVDPAVEVRHFLHCDGLAQPTEYIFVPVQAFGEVVAWLHRDAPPPGPEARPVNKAVAALDPAPGISERLVRFGEDDRCFGVLCRPDVEPHRRGVLILNTGLNHNVGNGRGGVRLARQLGQAGITSLRIDMNGLGDSLPVDPSRRVGFHDLGRIVDVQAAVDLLLQAGCTETLLTGICAGAYIGLHAAAQDDRIDAAVLVNLPYFYMRGEDPRVPWWRRPLSLAAHLLDRTREWRNARRLSFTGTPDRHYFNRRRLVTWSWRMAHYGSLWAGQRMLALVRPLLPRGWAIGRTDRLFRKLHARGAEVTLVYGDRDWGLMELGFVYAEQGRRLTRQGWAKVEILDRVDHTVTAPWMQAVLTKLIEKRLGICGKDQE